jgi:hypothetical protein
MLNRVLESVMRALRNVLPPPPCPWCRRQKWDRQPGVWWDCKVCGVVYNPATGRWRARLGVTWWR